MEDQNRQQVADQLNKLQKSGATDQQIEDFVNKSGYKAEDFNVDMSGQFRPLTVGEGKVAGVDYVKPTAAEQAESKQWDENLASSSTAVKTPPINETTTSFQQSYGGGSSTVYNSPPKDTAASTALEAQAKQNSKLAAAYEANPNSKFGQATLDRSLKEGTITQEQYDQLKNATPEQREANKQKASELKTEANTLRDKASQAKEPGETQVEVKPEPNSAKVETKTEQVKEDNTATKVDGEVPGNPNIKSETVDGQTVQTVNNGDGTSSITTKDGSSVTIDNENVQSTDAQALNEPVAFTPQDPDNINARDPAVIGQEDAFEKSRQDAELAYEEQIAANGPQTDPQAVNEPIAYTPEDPDNINARAEPEPTSPYYAEQGQQPPVTNADTQNANSGVAGSVNQTRPQQTIAVARNTKQKDDWRISLSLAPGAKYLYNLAVPGQILYPLRATDGVIFPYTPVIQTSYRANYDNSTDLIHSNYRLYFYKNSSVEELTIQADFTAQDTTEANYVLAVIHFFKSATKMFYGQDGNNGPKAGTPPPLCYLNGYGQYQFNEHPVLISNFQYNLPNDVDYIRAGGNTVVPGTNTDTYVNKINEKGSNLMSILRKAGNNLTQGRMSKEPQWQNYSSAEATYVPTKFQIQISLLPVVTRNDISRNFSLEKYATGELLRGNKRMSGGGIW